MFQEEICRNCGAKIELYTPPYDTRFDFQPTPYYPNHSDWECIRELKRRVDDLEAKLDQAINVLSTALSHKASR